MQVAVYGQIHYPSRALGALLSIYLDAALTYAGRGWHVFPLRPGTKDKPLTTHGHLDATLDAEQITAWWSDWPDANVAIFCEPSGVYALDIDPRHGGAQSYAALLQTHGQAHVDTYTVRTAGLGVHHYYVAPVEVRLHNSAGKLGAGIDTRSNGYLVAPPSTLAGGGSWDVIDSRDLQPLPPWMVQLLLPSTPLPSGPAEGVEIADGREVTTRVRRLAQELHDTPEGQRNDTAARIATMCGNYVAAGQIAQDTVVGLLLEATRGWSEPDKTRDTITRQVAFGMQTPRAWERRRGDVPVNPTDVEIPPIPRDEPMPPLAGPSGWATDAGQAADLVKQLGGTIIHSNGLGWFIWDGKVWRPRPEDNVKSVLIQFYTKRLEWAASNYMRDPLAPEAKNWNKVALAYGTFMSNSKLSTIMKVMQATPGCGLVELADLDRDLDLLNTPNGIVDLRTGKVVPHDRRRLMTKITRGSYIPDLKHPDWEQTLTILPAEVMDWVQAHFGQACTGYATPAQKMMILQGGGSNGKSAFVTDGTVRALGDYAMFAPRSLLTAGEFARGNASPEIVALRRVRFALIEELPGGRSVNGSALKTLVGTSTITGRGLFEPQITFDVTWTLVATTNESPTITESDHGTWRRLWLVHFGTRFVSDEAHIEQEGDRVGDPHLGLRLTLGMTGQHDAVITWLVNGAMRWYARPEILDEAPPSVVEKQAEWRKDCDPLVSFWEQSLVADPTGWVATKDLYFAACAHYEERGLERPSLRTFFKKFNDVTIPGKPTGRTKKTISSSRVNRPDAATRDFGGWLPLADRVEALPGMRWINTADAAARELAAQYRTEALGSAS